MLLQRSEETDKAWAAKNTKKKSGSEQSSVSQVCANSYLWNLYYFLFEEVILRIDLELRKMTDRWISFDSVSFCSHCLAQTFIFQLDFDNTTFSPYAPYFIVALLSWIYKRPLGKEIQFSSPQPFWHHGLVSWKIVFPWTGLGGGVCGFRDDSGTSHLLCTLFLLLLCKLHLQSSSVRSWRLATSSVDYLLRPGTLI